MRLTADGALYAVERVKRGIYSLNRLARWVQEGDIVVAVKGWQGSSGMDTTLEERPLQNPDALNWWQAAEVKEPQSDLGLDDDFAGLQVALVFEDAEVNVAPSFVDVLEYRGLSVPHVSKGNVAHVDPSLAVQESQAGFVDAMDVDVDMDANGVEMKQSPEELLDGMRDHYLQALYTSKVRIALVQMVTWYLTAFRHPWPTLLRDH